MKAMTKEIIEKLPKLRSQDGKRPEDVKVIIKFFDPTGSWTWFVTEGNPTGELVASGAFAGEPDYEFFGYVKGFEGEYGYFLLSDLSVAKQGLRGLQALPIERDRYYDATLAEAIANG